MSWLFDRLCEIAVADEIEVVIAVDSEPAPSLDETDWTEVLARAAAIPQLTVTTLPPGVAADVALGPPMRVVDLDRGAGAPVPAISTLLAEGRRLGRAVRVRAGEVCLRPVDADATTAVLERDVRLIVATDRPGRGELLRAAAQQGLGIAVRGVDPDAPVKVDSFAGVISIVDALVTLRLFAFGADGDTNTDHRSMPTSAPLGRPSGRGERLRPTG